MLERELASERTSYTRRGGLQRLLRTALGRCRQRAFHYNVRLKTSLVHSGATAQFHAGFQSVPRFFTISTPRLDTPTMRSTQIADRPPTHTCRARANLPSLLVAVVLCLTGQALEGQPIPRRADAPKPLAPSESAKRFRLPDDVRIELVAAEPLIADPSAVTWDAHGRLFVAEIHGYNLEGHYDVLELNKTGQLDRIVRRIPAGPKAKQAAEKETYGTIKRLVDQDGDGQMDAAHVFANRLPPCHGMVPARDGIIVVCRPHILFLADRDGDGKAEVRDVLFTGFGKTVLERSINNPRWGIDGWIYVCGGNAGGDITGPDMKRPVKLGTSDFRFRADGSAIEPVTGRTYTFGQTSNDWGDRFLISTRSPALCPLPIPYRYLARNPFLPTPDTVYDAAGYIRTYPASRPHPWRVERSREKEWSKYYTDRYGEAEAIANGYFTSACGPLIYRADSLPRRYQGNLFACEPSQNLVHRCLPIRAGLRYQARRAPDEQQSEFLTSTDQWFRPINLSTAPDGSIYIVDMYREIIEDYSAIPRYLQQQYGLIEGKDRGRIWRIVPAGHVRTTNRSNNIAYPGDLDAEGLVALLSHANPWWSQTAHRLLVEKSPASSSVVPAIANLLSAGKSPSSRLHALHLLAAIDRLTPESLQQALADRNFAVRRHALQLSESQIEQHAGLQDKVCALANDPDAMVRLQLALTLGAWQAPRSYEILRQLAKRDGGNRWFRAAILSSVAHAPHRFLRTMLDHPEPASGRHELLHSLASIIGARHRDKEITAVLIAAAHDGDDSGGATDSPADQLLSGLLDGLRRGRHESFQSVEGERALARLLEGRSAELRRMAVAVMGQLKLSSSTRLRALFAKLAEAALNEELSLQRRRSAVELLASGPWDLQRKTTHALLDPRQPLELQLGAVHALSNVDTPDVADVLLEHWNAMTPQVRTAGLRIIFGRTNRLPRLLAAIERGTVSPRSLGTYERTMLLENADQAIRAQAKKLFATSHASKPSAQIERYRAALEAERDAARGQAVFRRVCAACHRLQKVGTAIGPDLTSAQNRPDDAFLLDILQPSAKIAAGYESYLVVDQAGRIFTGVLASESATSITLRAGAPNPTDMGADTFEEHTILRKDIEQMKGLEQSLMPDDLHKLMTPRDLADLLAYLRTALGPAGATLQVLFDEQQSFAEMLNQGTGTAAVVSNDAFAGKLALKITPPQRYASTISGWSFRVREHPAPGEFRYLRLAWKTTGSGVLIELAADGNWPPAGSPQRRYYSGKNRTSWKATQVSLTPPQQWTVVTRDLWRDFGDFTLTGIAPTAMDGEALFDRIELLRSLDEPTK